MKQAARTERGFTLIELLVVIAVIGIIASITLVAMVTYRERAQAARVEQEVSAFQKAAAVFYASRLRYPDPSESSNAAAACYNTADPAAPERCCVSRGGCIYAGEPLETLAADGDFALAPAPARFALFAETAHAVLGGTLPSFLTEAPLSEGGNFKGVFYDCRSAGCGGASVYFSIPRARGEDGCPKGNAHNNQTDEGICEQDITGANPNGPVGEVCGDGACGESEACPDDCSSETHCSDTVDNDQDGNVDGDDDDCGSTETDCSDLSDNDGDGYTDCDDEDCSGDPACAPSEDCANGEDDDGDGDADCADTDCETAERCTGIEVSCEDGADNDEDSLSDCDDTDCAGASNCCDVCDTAGLCYDECGCNGDPYCGESSCVDGYDNDGNGDTDCADSQCDADPACVPTEAGFCADSQDNDSDGAYDCDDTECAGEPDVCDCGCDTNDCGPGSDPCYPDGDPYTCDDNMSDDPCYPSGDPYNCGESGTDSCETNNCNISDDPCETYSCGSGPGTCYPGGDPMNCSC